MARLPRYYVKGQPQHLIQRGNNRELIFACEEDYRFYLACLKDAAARYGTAVHAYVLMSNHIHLLATPDNEASLPKTMQSVGRRYVQYFNYHYERTGTLWEGRYKATLIDSTDYLLTCMRYIELNAVRANMVKHPRDYPWHSYHYNALGQGDKLITPHRIYRALSKGSKGSNGAEQRRSQYRQLFRAQIAQRDLDAIREATNKAWVLGGDRFRAKIEKLSNRRVAPKPRGRPPIEPN